LPRITTRRTFASHVTRIIVATVEVVGRGRSTHRVVDA
jgi:hypothetical protein